LKQSHTKEQKSNQFGGLSFFFFKIWSFLLCINNDFCYRFKISVAKDNSLKYTGIKVKTLDSSLIILKVKNLANRLLDKKKLLKKKQKQKDKRIRRHKPNTTN